MAGGTMGEAGPNADNFLHKDRLTGLKQIAIIKCWFSDTWAEFGPVKAAFVKRE